MNNIMEQTLFYLPYPNSSGPNEYSSDFFLVCNTDATPLCP
ncbi:hypothetical protein DSUL_30101 [Desulfovibrionales bacterium]